MEFRDNIRWMFFHQGSTFRTSDQALVVILALMTSNVFVLGSGLRTILMYSFNVIDMRDKICGRAIYNCNLSMW